MITILLVLAALIVLLQAGLMATLRKLVQQLDAARERIAALESRMEERASRPQVEAAPPERMSASFVMHDAPVPVATRAARAAPRFEPDVHAELEIAPPPARAPARRASVAREAEPSLFDASDAGPDARALRAEMISLMRQLVSQGLSVRDIAARCGLSEAEAELMLSLQGTQA